jgi:hypothetical protein
VVERKMTERDGNFQSFDLQSWVGVINDQRDERDRIVLEACVSRWREGQCLPLELLRDFAWSAKGDKWLEEYHPFYNVIKATEQIKTAFEILVSARASLISVYGNYHAAITYDGFKSAEKASMEATQDIFKYVFAASALVQAYRRFLSIDDSFREGFNRELSASFHKKGLMDFIQKLRNCYGHQNLFKVVPVGTVHFGDKKSVESGLIFEKSRLLEIDNAWNREAKEFIERAERLDLLDIIDEYHKMAKSLFKSYQSASGVIYRPDFQEIARCKLATKLVSKMTWLGVMLQQARQRNVDPYRFVGDYFTEAELERIHCLRPNSREQVDFMIQLRDPIGLCRDDLRQSLYSFFGCA